MERAILTIATGKPYYARLATNLARSFLLSSSTNDSEIRFVLATDYPNCIPRDVTSKIDVMTLDPGQFGNGFSSKLYLDRIAPADETLFIDSDCLCVRDLDFVFDKFKDHHVGVIGQKQSAGEHFGDIGDRCRRFQIPWVPVFVGGIYFVRRGETARHVFEKARALEKRYDELGFVRLRGMPNEEPLIGVGMVMYNQEPIADDGTIKADVMLYRDRPKVNVLNGVAQLTGGGQKPSSTWCITPPANSNPAIVHFNASYAEQPPYTTEALKLAILAKGYPPALVKAYAAMRTSLPYYSFQIFKSILRPLYRRLFGFRPIKTSPRLP